MRIATWNVNSIGARLPRLLDWLETTAPDVVAVQETKAGEASFPYEPLRAAGYEAVHVGDGRWNGVAVLSRIGVEPVATSLPNHTESRYVSVQCGHVGCGEGRGVNGPGGGLRVTSVYVPNGRELGHEQYDHKLKWFASLADVVAESMAGGPQVIMGDFNVALHDDDVFDIAAFAGSTHVTAPERAAVQTLLDLGLTDVVARPGKGDRPFTYWDYRAGMFHKDLGMRIDYILASSQVRVLDAYVDRLARKGKLPSDHAPIVADIALDGVAEG
jgi:exodeoxyribonuclease III